MSKIMDDLLLKYYKLLKPNKKEHKMRERWIDLIKSKILKVCPNSRVELFGSFFTGLYLHKSDIDLSVNINTENPNLILRTIKNELMSTDLFYEIVHLSNAKIPILKFKCKDLKIKFDISINNLTGINARNFIVKKLKEDENIKLFVLLFKYFISSRNLGDASSGGLNFYSQFLMIISYLDLHPFYQKNNLSVTFFDFVQYYGFDFNYKNVQIDCSDNTYKVNNNNRISIIDPIDKVDVGSNCKNIDVIKEVLQNFYRVILYHFNNDTIEEIFTEMFCIKTENTLKKTSTHKKSRKHKMYDLRSKKNTQEVNDVYEDKKTTKNSTEIKSKNKKIKLKKRCAHENSIDVLKEDDVRQIKTISVQKRCEKAKKKVTKTKEKHDSTKKKLQNDSTQKKVQNDSTQQKLQNDSKELVSENKSKKVKASVDNIRHNTQSYDNKIDNLSEYISDLSVVNDRKESRKKKKERKAHKHTKNAKRVYKPKKKHADAEKDM